MKMLEQRCIVYYFVYGIFFIACANGYISVSDKPCAARKIEGKSVICVCNSTYCDTITRVSPARGTYVAYTSSESGLRFQKTFGHVLKYSKGQDVRTGLELDPSVLYQPISGFGTAVTDSAGINWNSLCDPRTRQNLVNSYYGSTGLEYNMMRVPIGGTDFSDREYAYDVPRGDFKLNGFSLAPEDYNLKIPLIKACMEVATEPIRIIGSLWSPPAWMKTSNNLNIGYLNKECFQTLADYFYKFIENYAYCGVPIWAITTSNEPLAGTMFPSNLLNTLQWTAPDMGNWIENNLGPTIRNSTFKNVKIIGGDDQRFTLPLWFNNVIMNSPGALKYIDGMAVHFYFNDVTPPSQLDLALEDYPDIFLISTEACEGFGPNPIDVDLGSWARAENYATNIIEDLNHKSIGWIDWNMCLDETGGPSWSNNNVDSPIIVSAANQEFYKQPMFYAMGHFSKFIPRGSRRMKLTMTGGSLVSHVAFLTPQKTIVVVMLNKTKKKEVAIRLGAEYVIMILEDKSITTVEFPYKSHL